MSFLPPSPKDPIVGLFVPNSSEFTQTLSRFGPWNKRIWQWQLSFPTKYGIPKTLKVRVSPPISKAGNWRMGMPRHVKACSPAQVCKGLSGFLNKNGFLSHTYKPLILFRWINMALPFLLNYLFSCSPLFSIFCPQSNLWFFNKDTSIMTSSCMHVYSLTDTHQLSFSNAMARVPTSQTVGSTYQHIWINEIVEDFLTNLLLVTKNGILRDLSGGIFREFLLGIILVRWSNSKLRHSKFKWLVIGRSAKIWLNFNVKSINNNFNGQNFWKFRSPGFLKKKAGIQGGKLLLTMPRQSPEHITRYLVKPRYFSIMNKTLRSFWQFPGSTREWRRIWNTSSVGTGNISRFKYIQNVNKNTYVSHLFFSFP